MLGHMLLNDAVSPVIKLDTCITCLRMHCMVHGTARLQGECNSHKIPVETGHTWCCPWSLLLCPWIVPSLTPPPKDAGHTFMFHPPTKRLGHRWHCGFRLKGSSNEASPHR